MMEKDFLVDKKYLNIPICAQKEERLLKIFLLDRENGTQEKLTEVMVPVDEEQDGKYTADFCAQIPVEAYRGKEIRVSLEEAPDIFSESVCLSDEREEAADTRSGHPFCR